MAKQLNKNEVSKSLQPKIQIIKYSEKSHIIIGDTFLIKDILNKNGAAFNKHLTHPENKIQISGWVIPSTKYDQFSQILNNYIQKQSIISSLNENLQEENNHRVFIVHKDNSQPTEFDNITKEQAEKYFNQYINYPNAEIITWDKTELNEFGNIISRPTIKIQVNKENRLEAEPVKSIEVQPIENKYNNIYNKSGSHDIKTYNFNNEYGSYNTVKIIPDVHREKDTFLVDVTIRKKYPDGDIQTGQTFYDIDIKKYDNYIQDLLSRGAKEENNNYNEIILSEKINPIKNEPAFIDNNSIQIDNKNIINLSNPEKQTTIQHETVSNEHLEKITDFGQKIGGARKDTSSSGYLKAKTNQHHQPSWMKDYNLGELENGGFKPFKTKGNFIVWQSKENYKTSDEAVLAIKLHNIARDFSIYNTKNNDYAIYRNVTDRKRHIIKEGFTTKEDAYTYMVENADSLVEYKPSFPIRPHIEKLERTGKEYRPGNTNVTTHEFFETFGFTGGEFGNWIPQDERQRILNMTYDGLMDLSETLRLPPKALSLNGQLSIAWGARGQGLSSATAHYERDRAVFNLTRIKGAGSVAHEWFHSLDHYFGSQDKGKTLEKDEKGIVKSFSNRDSDFISHGSSPRSQIREELKEQFKQLLTVIYKQPKIVEISLDRYEHIKETSNKELQNSILILRNHIAKERQYGKKKIAASPEQITRFDTLVDKIKKGELGNETFISTKEKYYNKINTFEIYKELNNLIINITGRSELKRDSGLIKDISNYKTRETDAILQLEKYRIDNKEERFTPTKFSYDAKDIDKMRTSDYWSTEHEMAARAFESYVEDKINFEGYKSQYLVHSTQNSIYKSLFNLNPYPEDQERETINKAFDNLFLSFKTNTNENNNVIMFRRSSNDLLDHKIHFVSSYYDSPNAQKLAHLVKEGDKASISKMAFQMSFYCPDKSILVPIPNKSGNADISLELSNLIAGYTDSEVKNIITGKQRESLYNYKKQNKSIPDKNFFSFHLSYNENIDTKNIFLVDNVLSSGFTYDAILDLLPGANLLVHSVDLDMFKSFHPQAEINSNSIIVKRSQFFTPEFLQWFDKSKINDEKGAPLKVYHSSTVQIKEFDRSKLGTRTKDCLSYLGFHFSPNKEMVTGVISAQNVIPTYLSIKNPYITKESDLVKEILHLANKNGKINHDKIDFKALISLPYFSPEGHQSIANVLQQDAWGSPFGKKEKPIINYKEISNDFLSHLKSQGYDGIKYINEIDWSFENRYDYIAFEPNQIKHAELNTGTFNAKEANILYHRDDHGAFNRMYEPSFMDDHIYIETTLHNFNSKASNVPDLIVVQNQSQLIDSMIQQGSSDNVILEVKSAMDDKIDAFYDPSINKTFFISDNIKPNKESIKKIWIHEQLQHNGIIQLIPNDNTRNTLFEKIVTDIGRDKILNDIRQEAGNSYNHLPNHMLANEYLAFLAEKRLMGYDLTALQQSLWDKIKNIIDAFLSAIFSEQHKINDQDLTMIIKASALSVMNPDLKENKNIQNKILHDQVTTTIIKKEIKNISIENSKISDTKNLTNYMVNEDSNTIYKLFDPNDYKHLDNDDIISIIKSLINDNIIDSSKADAAFSHFNEKDINLKT